MKLRAMKTLGGVSLALLCSSLAGCTAFYPQSGWGAIPQGAPALVYYCANIGPSSPTRYACSDGKVYTSFDLEKQRLAWETAQNTEAHPAYIPAKE